MDMLKYVVPPLHPEGRRFVIAAVLVTLVLFWAVTPLGWLGLVLSAYCVYFFRDPERVVPDVDGALVSPGDGVVSQITQAPPPRELDMGADPRTRISIFLSVFNVHVNRVPAAGRITDLIYVPGKFVNAALDKASEDNERQIARMKTTAGHDIAFVQIAGLVARRIVCGLEVDQTVAMGERFGIIRFGSRVDVYLDGDLVPMVVEGQTVVGGETILADGRFGEPARQGRAV